MIDVLVCPQPATVTERAASATLTASCTGPQATAVTAGTVLTTQTDPTAGAALKTTIATLMGIAACPAAAALLVSPHRLLTCLF